VTSPDDRDAAMAALAAEAVGCTRCDLHATGTPVVWGEGDPHAAVMFVGQGPGEQESKRRRPFVGPAGELLDRALAEVGIDRRRLWLTNAIKHWATSVNPRGVLVNRPPRVGELRACAIWLEGELAIVRPRLILCIGAPAAQAVIDKGFKITEERGQWRRLPSGAEAMATFHTSYLLRLRSADRDAFEAAWSLVLGDLRAVVERAREQGIDLGPDG
jgi:DNA polymerase